MNAEYKKVENLLKKSQYTVVLTGAGMSTESGLPDFRSSQGLWNGRNPEEIASVHALEKNRDAFVEFYRWRIEQLHQFEPHQGHHMLTQWQRQGLIQQIITQNVDGFHQQATSHDVIELHGSLRQLRCMGCSKKSSSDRYLSEDGFICPHCNGFLRPDIVLFGEALDERAISRAIEGAREAELFIVMGSSLHVSPANILPVEAINQGAFFIIMNEGPTSLDGHAHLIVQGKIGEILPKLQI
jgi:NAD-dependent deacetylase